MSDAQIAAVLVVACAGNVAAAFAAFTVSGYASLSNARRILAWCFSMTLGFAAMYCFSEAIYHMMGNA
jgi:hypothetical protein